MRLVLAALLGFVLGLGAVYWGFRLQQTYILVNRGELNKVLDIYNQLLLNCKKPVTQNYL